MSGWVTHVAGPIDDRPDIGLRGAFGTGNGRVFGLIGMTDPLNTLHGLVGPSYEKGERFFGDYAIELAPAGGAALDFEEEWAARSLSSTAVLTRGRLGELTLDTIDFAPSVAGSDHCLLRALRVANGGASSSPAYDLRVRAARPLSSPAPGVIVEASSERTLTTTLVGRADAEVRSDEQALVLPLGSLDAGEERELLLAHCARDGSAPEVIGELDVDSLLEATTASYQAWERDLLQLDLPDPMVADFVDGMKLTLKVQTAASGAACPMSQYTRTWARDNIGPVLALLDLGAHDDVAAMMDYVYGAVLLGGDLSNSYAADLDLSELPPPPDWDAMPPLSGRVAAETPSYMVWIYGAHQLHSGDIARADERFGFLRRSLLAQALSPDGLLPFTGDETYRTAMDVAFGFALAYLHEDLSWSANSSLLWLGAQRHFIRLAEGLGLDGDVAAAQSMGEIVEAAAIGRYLLDDGCISPLVDRESDETWPAPFEDVALKVTWAGWKDGDDPAARDMLACLRRRAQVGPGDIQSPLHESYRESALLPQADAVYTGMLPGYTLAALVDAGDIEASAAVNALGKTLSSSGNIGEYLFRFGDERSGLTIIYDDSGVVGDYTSKFRPWEGGILLDALLHYLVGFSPDAPAGAITLRPHLPPNWPAASYRGLRIGDDRLDLHLSRAAEEIEVRVRSHAARSYQLTLRWDAPADWSPRMTVGGQTLPTDTLVQRQHGGQQSLTSPPLPLPAGGELTFTL